MSLLSDIASGLIAALCSFTIVSAGGCGTDAKGIDDCRSIEAARCEAAKNCDIGVTDVDACRRFYRDQCLHGLSVDSPGAPAVSACVATIRAAGQCATSKETRLDSCASPVTTGPTSLTTACQVVTTPEATPECAFLVPSASGGSGSGGSAGTAGNAGTAGSAGSGGTGGGSGSSGDAGAAN